MYEKVPGKLESEDRNIAHANLQVVISECMRNPKLVSHVFAKMVTVKVAMEEQADEIPGVPFDGAPTCVAQLPVDSFLAPWLTTKSGVPVDKLMAVWEKDNSSLVRIFIAGTQLGERMSLADLQNMVLFRKFADVFYQRNGDRLDA